MSAAIAAAFERATRFDVYAVLHLNRYADGFRGEETAYKKAALDLMVRLSKRVFGKSKYRRLPRGSRLLPNMITIEKLTDGPHLNVIMQRPANMDFEMFRARLLEEWFRSPWAANDHGAFYCEPREPGSRLVGYCHKEIDRVCVDETMTF